MGQHRKIVETEDPFLLGLDRGKPKNGQVVQKKVKQPAAAAEEDDPFMLGVKKKDSVTAPEPSSTESAVGTEPTPQSQLPSGSAPVETTEEPFVSKLFPDKSIFAAPDRTTIFEKSFLDRDIERPQELDLTNPELSRSSNKYSLRNLYTDAAKARFDEKNAEEKFLIKKDLPSLRAYARSRIAEINGDIKRDSDEMDKKTQEYANKSGSIVGVGGLLKENEKMQDDIAAAIYYKNQLKNSIAVEAARKLAPLFVSPDKPLNPIGLSRAIMNVADPEYDGLLRQAEKKYTLSGITQGKIERIGLDISLDYLKSLPQTPEVQKKIAEVQALEDTFDTRNIEMTAQRAREKLGVYFYDKGKSGFWGYSIKNIAAGAADPQAGLSDNEKKAVTNYVIPSEKKLGIWTTNIPGSGFGRMAINAIEKSLLGTANWAAGFFGDRNDSDRAMDLLDEEVKGSRFRAPGENPMWKAELAALNIKEESNSLTPEETLRKVELEKYVDVRSGWAQVRDGTGDLTGQVAAIIAVSKGIGLIGKGVQAIGGAQAVTRGLTYSSVGSALSNPTTQLFLGAYVNSYDNYRTQALSFMPGDENAANRDAYAKTMASFEGISERIFNDLSIVKAFQKSIKPSISAITTQFINREITQQVARELTKKTLIQNLKTFGKHLAIGVNQESIEEGVVDLADDMSKTVFGGLPFDIVETGKKAVNTYLTTAMSSGVVSGLAARGQMRQQKADNAFIKAGIMKFAADPAPALQEVDNLLLTKQITQEEANEKISLIKSANKYLKEIPDVIPTVQSIHGNQIPVDRQLDFPETTAYVLARLNEGIINNKLKPPAPNKPMSDGVLKTRLEKELKTSEKIRDGILKGTLGVTPDLQVVAPDKETAQELGVLDATQMPQEELIGTPFTNIKTQTDEKTSDEKSTSGQKTEDQKTSSQTDQEGQVGVLTPAQQAQKMFKEKLPKKTKYDRVEVEDVVTGKPMVNWLTRKPASARAVVGNMKKRFETLEQLVVNCLT